MIGGILPSSEAFGIMACSHYSWKFTSGVTCKVKILNFMNLSSDLDQLLIPPFHQGR